jgi:hypothetical protein
VQSIGQDSWTSNSPHNQLIVSDPNSAELKSDNLEALLSLYATLGSSPEQIRFANALLKRLDADKGYLSVSYFIVCVLWKIDRLADALQKTRQNLPEDEHRVFGLSNVLLLLNGLLKFRHPDFTNAMLDEIEKLIHGLKEHTFKISDKIAVIRTTRLSLMQLDAPGSPPN